MAIDLTGVSQLEYLTRKRGGQPPVNPAYLTAIRKVGRKKGVGVIWETQCGLCGSLRNVPAMYFTSGRIKKCEMCVDQNKADTSNLIQRRYEIEEIRKKEEDKGWYPEPFRSEFRQHLAAFNPIQQLLFETIMDKRPRRNDFLMQAVDIVVRTTEKDMDIEFGTYGKARIERARRRLPKEIRMQTTKFIPVEEIPSLAYTTPRSMQEANPFLQMSGSVGSRNGDRTSSRHTKNFSR